MTETAREGYYVVFLVRSDGSGFYLSLNQATTAVRQLHGGSRYLDVLADQATTYAAYLPSDEIEGLEVGKLDLEAVGNRSKGYEAGNVVGKFYAADNIPHDVALAEDVRWFLRLYSRLVEGLDGIEIENSPDAPPDAKKGTEAKRYRWHLRAEGRNSGVVKRAKQLQGYVCGVCEVDFEDEYGPLGRRSIDAHHKKPFSELDERPTDLDPVEDFDIVCANHHRMLHSETPPVTVAQLRETLGLT